MTRLQLVNPRWMNDGACAETHDLVFFDVNDPEKRAQEADERYCRSCPVRITCLAYALKTKSPGVWAGTSEEQRKKLARTRNRAKCPVCLCEKLITVGEHDLCMACAHSWRTEHRPGSTEHQPNDDGGRGSSAARGESP